MKEIYFKVPETPWEEVVHPATGVALGVRNKVFETENAVVTFKEVDYTGGIGISHKHAHEQIIYILSGTMRIDIEGTNYMLNAGDMLAIPPWAQHTTEVMNKEGVKNLVIFAPKPEAK